MVSYELRNVAYCGTAHGANRSIDETVSTSATTSIGVCEIQIVVRRDLRAVAGYTSMRLRMAKLPASFACADQAQAKQARELYCRTGRVGLHGGFGGSKRLVRGRAYELRLGIRRQKGRRIF